MDAITPTLLRQAKTRVALHRGPAPYSLPDASGTPPGPDACPPSAPFDAVLTAVIDHLLVIEDHQLAIEDHQLAIAAAFRTVRSLLEEVLL